MIKIYGTTLSNYYSTAKAALVEKGLAFEEVSIMPSQDPEVLAKSPMGKVPYVEVEDTTLTETNVIFDYLEDIQPQPALYPGDPWARAKTKEIIRFVELYLDTPARRHLPTVYFGAPVDQAAYETVRPLLENGLRALKQLGRFEPYIAGDTFTFADLTAYFELRFTNMHTTQIYDWDITTEVPGLGEYLHLVGERPAVNAVDAVMQRDFAAFKNKS
jgi:glutathione S-transferase